MKTVISTDVFATQTITGKGDTLTVNQDAAILSGSDTGILGTGNVDLRYIKIFGGVKSDTIGIDIQSSTAKSGDIVQIGKSGVVEGGDDSVRISSDAAQLVNDGIMIGRAFISGYGGYVNNRGTMVDDGAGLVLVGTKTTLINSGAINGWYNVGAFLSGTDSSITNTGVISGRHYGITVDTLSTDGEFAITNNGVIRGTDAAINLDSVASIHTVLSNSGLLAGAVILDDGNDRIVNSGKFLSGFSLGSGNDRFVNTGTVAGMATMGDGNDTFVSRTGKINGVLAGGDDNDTFVLSRQTTDIVEFTNNGFDVVKSSGSFALGSNFEKLVLTGTRNINGIGNNDANDLIGNRGANRLSGLDGADRLSGGRGADILTGGADTDILTGGAGRDTFVFAKGFGTDTVTDFANGIDGLDLRDWDQITSFFDLKNHHLTVVGDDLLITAGTDSLTIKDTSMKELDATDFQF